MSTAYHSSRLGAAAGRSGGGVSAEPAPGGPAPAAGGGAGARGAGPGRGGPQAVPPGGYFFVQLSDTQFGFSNNDVDFVQDTVNAEFAIATVNRLKPAFVVVTGNPVNKPGEPQMAEYRRIMATLDPAIPLYNISGNHDVENEPTPASMAAYPVGTWQGLLHVSPRRPAGNCAQLDGDSHAHPGASRPQGAGPLAARGAGEAAAPGSPARGSVPAPTIPFLKKADEPDHYSTFPLCVARRSSTCFGAPACSCRLGPLASHDRRDRRGADVRGDRPVGRPLGGQWDSACSS